MFYIDGAIVPLLSGDNNVGPIEPEWDGCPVISSLPAPCSRLPNCSPISCIGMAVNNNVLAPPPLFDIMMTG